MSVPQSQPLPSTRRLLKATAIAVAIAAILLVLVVLPAEYGIDPTGVGSRLGLDALGSSGKAAALSAPEASSELPGADAKPGDAAEVVKAHEVFGASPGQSFDTGAVSRTVTSSRNDNLEVTLPPGKGAEVKALLKAGDGIAFHWTASGDVALDMHGERTGAKDAWTSYWIEAAAREGSGTFIAPFEGSHGWYWQNRGTEAVTVRIEVSGFQEKLYQPGKN